jgi:ABC-type branched-subunit amino acid transport system substrate-binding protein
VSALENSLVQGETFSLLSNVLPEEIDFRAVALKARRAQIDALGIFVYPHQAITLYRSMAAIGFKPPSFGTDVFESVRVVEGSGPAIEGAVYANMVMPGWFAKEYIAKVGNQDQIAYAFNGYAWSAISAELFSRIAHHPSAEEIVALYTSVTGHEGGVDFKYRHTAEGGHYWEFPVELKVIEGGLFKSAARGR